LAGLINKKSTLSCSDDVAVVVVFAVERHKASSKK